MGEHKCNRKKDIDYNVIYDTIKYIEAFNKCKKGVRWKGSVQNFMQTPLFYITEQIDKFENGKFDIQTNCARVVIFERGKARSIVPIDFSERILEHVICDNILLPIFENKLIYANGASLKGKGTEFSRDLLNKYMSKAVKKCYEYAVKFDVKSYFDSISHKVVYDILSKNIEDKNVLKLIMNIVLSYRRGDYVIAKKSGKITDDEYNQKIKDLENLKDRGVCLGSQVSQILALVVLNDLDHYIKENLHMKFYIRYMDDGIILCKTKEEANEVLVAIKERIKKVDLTFGKDKTYVVKLSKGFTFLKVNYRVEGERIIRKLHRTSVTRMRRKLKKFEFLVEGGSMSKEDVFNSLQSWFAHSFAASAYETRVSMLDIYKNIFSYKIDWFEEHLTTMYPQKKCA